MSLSSSKTRLQIQTPPKSRNKRAIEIFEDATAKGKYDYWLTQEDIADIARIEYNHFKNPSIPDLFEFETSGSISQLTTKIKILKESTQLTGNRLTIIINLNNQHWATLVITRRYSAYDGFYIDSQGYLLPDEYYALLRRFNIVVNDLSLYFSQQTDSYNCGLWALENAVDINKMLNEDKPHSWLKEQIQRPRNIYYFNGRRRFLAEKLRLDSIRRERLTSYSETFQPGNEVLKNNDPSLEQVEPTAKRLKIQPAEKDNLEVRLENFVESFISYFRQKIAAFQLIARGEKLTIVALKQELKTGATGALFGLAVSRSLPGTIPSMVASLRTVSSRYYISKAKARKITRVFSSLRLGDLSDILATAAAEIFQSFEAQFMHVTDKAGDKLAMQKLAEDAVARALNYISEESKVTYVSVDYITKAIILGNSDKYFDPNLKKFRLSILGNSIQDEHENKIYTTYLFEKVGLYIKGSPTKYYKKIKLAEIAHYGYRSVLNWEKTENNALIEDYGQDYEQVINPQQERGFQSDLKGYIYLLQPATIKSKAQVVLTKIINGVQNVSVVKPTVKKSIIFNLRVPIENFIGRDAALNELHRTLLLGRTATIVSAISEMSLGSVPNMELASGAQAAISGLGGIGKTQLALRYAQLHVAEYDNNVLWINSETKLDLSHSFSKLAAKLDIEIKDKYGEYRDIESIVEEIYEYFSDRKSLFIFDNVENYVEIEPFLPKSMVGNKPSLLITSRYKNWQNAASVILLDVFTEQESLALVKKGLSINDDFQDAKIKLLHNLLHGLPLALQQAIAYIKIQKNLNSSFSIESYIEIFKAKTKDVLDFNFRTYSNDPYLKTVYMTWQVTLDRLKKEGKVGEIALDILNIMSFIFPENISMETFSVFYTRNRLSEAMHLLRIYSMTNAGSVSSECVIHRLMQKVVNLHLEINIAQFKRVALKAEALVMHYEKNMETRFHYIYFLLNIINHPELESDLQFKPSFKRISSILRIADVKMWSYFLDVAYTKFNKEKYIEFITEAFLNYRKQAAPFYVLNMLQYIEKKMLEGVLSKKDVEMVLGDRYLDFKPEYRVNTLSTEPEKRERQLYIISRVGEFKKKIFPERYLPPCLFNRKKRSVGSCLQYNQGQRESEQHKALKHLGKVTHIARFVSTGLFAKDTMAALLRGDFSDVAINFSLLLSGKLFGSLSNTLLAQDEKLIAGESALLQKELTLENKAALDIFLHEGVILSGKRKLLSKTIKMASPFIARGTSIFFAYNLINDIQRYKSGDTGVLSRIVSNGAIVAIDGVEASIEAAELLEIITGVSEFTGPIGEGAVVLIWVAAEGYEMNKGLGAIEKCVDLTLTDKFIQGLRLFFGMGPSEYIELKAKNNQLIQHALSFLKEHSEVKRYVFSAAFTETDSHTRSEVHLDNKFNLTLSESMPDVPSHTQLFCISGTRTAHSLLHLGAQKEVFNRYFCKKAIGIEYAINRTGNATLIALDTGDDKVIVVSQTPTIFLVNEGNKAYKGNDNGNLFFMLGNNVTGTLEGGNGIDLVFLNNFYANLNVSVLIDRQRFLCAKRLALYELIPQCDSQNKVALKKINQIYGRLNKKDVFYLTKNITLVDGKGGESEAFPDIIYVTSESEQGLKITLRANTQVNYIDSNLVAYPVDHVIPSAQQGRAQVDFPFHDNIQLRFFFDYYFENLTAITIDNYRLQFNLSSAQSIDFQHGTFSLTLKNSLVRSLSNSTTLPKNAYYFFKDGIQIKLLDKNHIYANVESVRNLDNLIDSFIAAANQLGKAFTIQLSYNQTVSIGQEKNEILITNCLSESYLIGNGGENVYVISPLNTTSFPLPEVVLYDVSEDVMEEFRDTLDLREVIRKVNSACPMQTLSITLRQEGDDLVLGLNSFYYLLNQECVRADTRWIVASVRLKKALLTEWYQKLDILLENHRPRNILYSEVKGWYLTDIPLTFDNKEIIVLTNQDINQNSELAILKNVGNFTFLNRNETDLIITNILDENTPHYDFYTIICSRFYELAEMREKVLSLTLLFLDQVFSLETYEAQINRSIHLSSILESYHMLKNSSILILATDPQLRVSVNQTHEVPGIRNKRYVNFHDEKPVSSSAKKNSPLFYYLSNWFKRQSNLFVSRINKYVLDLNNKFFTKVLLNPSSGLNSHCENAIVPRIKQTIPSLSKNESKLLNQKINYQKKMTKKRYSKWNKFKQTEFFTQVCDCREAKNSSVYVKQQINYRKAIFPESDAPLPYQDNQFRSGIFLPQVTLHIDVNETLVFANYLLRAIKRK